MTGHVLLEAVQAPEIEKLTLFGGLCAQALFVGPAQPFFPGWLWRRKMSGCHHWRGGGVVSTICLPLEVFVSRPKW